MESKQLVFQTILSSPGMNEKCKISLQLSRQNIVLICRLMEAGLSPEKDVLNDDIFSSLSKENLDELKGVYEEILKKGELTDFYQRLKQL